LLSNRTRPGRRLLVDGINRRGCRTGGRTNILAQSGLFCYHALLSCWRCFFFYHALLSCFANSQGAIKKLFDNPEYNPRGKYSIRLFNITKGVWEWVDIDDKIPCYPNNGGPAYAQPKGRSVWVLLLEKACTTGFVWFAYAKLFAQYMHHQTHKIKHVI
jgi:hypothetical protein